MPKRTALVMLGVAMAAAMAGVPAVESRAQVPRSPNFLVIVTDDQRSDTMMAMPKTEGWFASRGTRFVNGFATTPLCCPSRASIFTGRYAHNHGVRGNSGAHFVDQETTIQYYLRNLGYRTGMFGKYLNRWTEPPPYFDEWATPQSNKYVSGVWNVDGEAEVVWEYSTDYLTAKTIDFVERAETVDLQPWLAFVAPQAAHRPYTPGPEYVDHEVPGWFPDLSINEEDVSDKPAYVRDQPLVRMRKAERRRARQLRTLFSVDDLVDDVFNRLSELGELENTYVFFLSDNGFAWGDHRLLSSGTLKNTPYTNSVKIPFFLYGPTLAPNGYDERLVANIDVAPTILDLVPVPLSPDPPMDGRSLIAGTSRQWLLLEWWEARKHVDIPPWRSLRSQTAQYTEYTLDDGSTVLEYYDLTNDVFQLRNLLGDDDPANDPDVTQLHSLLDDYSTCAGSSCP